MSFKINQNMSLGFVPLDLEREEELPAGEVPQLAPRSQRLPDDVHASQDRKTGSVHDGFGGKGLTFSFPK